LGQPCNFYACACTPGAVDELYDLAADPDELRNLAAEPRWRPTLERLMGLVWERVQATGDRTLLNTHYYSMRFAVVGPNAAAAPEKNGLAARL
jgi:hypothetical protein